MSIKHVTKEITVTKWETSDGKLFNRRDEAESHDALLSATFVYLVEEHPHPGTSYITAICSTKEAAEQRTTTLRNSKVISVPMDIELSSAIRYNRY